MATIGHLALSRSSLKAGGGRGPRKPSFPLKVSGQSSLVEICLPTSRLEGLLHRTASFSGHQRVEGLCTGLPAQPNLLPATPPRGAGQRLIASRALSPACAQPPCRRPTAGVREAALARAVGELRPPLGSECPTHPPTARTLECDPEPHSRSLRSGPALGGQRPALLLPVLPRSSSTAPAAPASRPPPPPPPQAERGRGAWEPWRASRRGTPSAGRRRCGRAARRRRRRGRRD